MSSLPVLFDANRTLGSGASMPVDFHSATDLLTEMDRLGIARTLVWHQAAQDCHARTANELLLEELANTPGAAERLVPAFCISPVVPYETGTLDWLKTKMTAHGSRALRFPLMRNAWKLCEIEPVIEALLPQQPVLFFTIHDPHTKEDVLGFTERFPTVTLVLTNVMWPNVIDVMDLMRRRENIRIDSSWLHAHCDIELIVEHLGADRILFGTAYRACAGAGIARLKHVAISQPEREAIAHGNLEELLGLDAVAAAPKRPAKPLWDALLDDKPLDIDVVDAHGHLGPLGMYPMDEAGPAAHAKQMATYMDRLGIDLTIVSGARALFTDPVSGNRQLEELLKPYEGRIHAYFTFNPRYADALVEQLDASFSRPCFVGFKLLTSYWNVSLDDPRFEPCWAYAHAHRLPILVHTWGKGAADPALLTDVAPAYPDAVLLLAHCGGPEREAAIKLVEQNPNVYLEWAGGFTSPEPWQDALQRTGGRMVFGTDSVAHNATWELGRLLSQDIPDDQLVPILGANMRDILARRR